MQDRRAHERHSVWFPITVSSDSGEGTAISYDVSTGGLLMACPGRVEPGAEITVTFRVRGDAPEQTARGRVIRVEENQPEGAWRWRIAVGFESEVPEIEALLASAPASGTSSAAP